MIILRKLYLMVLAFMIVTAAWGIFSLDLNTSSIDFGSNLNPDSSPFNKSSAVIATVKNSDALNNWSLQTNAAGDITSNVQSTTIPINQLQLKGGSLLNFTALRVTPSLEIDTGTSSAGVGTFNIVMDYRLILKWNNVAASDYKAIIWYTLTGL